MHHQAQTNSCQKDSVMQLIYFMILLLCRKDFYDILQVPKGASDSLIKRSYRKLALQYHPVRIVNAVHHRTKFYAT